VEEVERCLIQPRLRNFALGIGHNCLDEVKAVVVLYELEMTERGVEDVDAASVFVAPVVCLVFDVDYRFNEAAVVRDWVEVFEGSFSGHWLVLFRCWLTFSRIKSPMYLRQMSAVCRKLA